MPRVQRLGRLAAAIVAALALAVSLPSPVWSEDGTGAPLVYPATRRDATVEVRHGRSAPDPYRWLEGDPASDPDVAIWAGQQDTLARRYLARLPERAGFARSVRELTDIERFSLPRKAGGRYFYLRNSGLQDQSVLYVREGRQGAARVLLDPGSLRQGSALALDDWQPSPDGKLVALSFQVNGTDERTLRVLRVADGALLAETLGGAVARPLAWTGPDGFLYVRQAGADSYGARRGGTEVWFHRAGTPQPADLPVYRTPAEPDLVHTAQVTSDCRWAVISSRRGLDNKAAVRLVNLARLSRDGWKAFPLAPDTSNDWRLVDGMRNHLWFVTDKGAANGRLLRIDMSHGGHPRAFEVVRETTETLERGRMIGNRLILSYRSGGVLRAEVVDLKGRRRSGIALNAIGTATGFTGRPGDSETFYTFSSFAQPPGVWRLDLATGQISPFALPHVPFDPADVLVERRHYPGKDGTMVPIYVVRSREAVSKGRAVPTLLYGYGGFDLSLNPGYSPARMAWIRAGGAFALAAVRGGGELGESWHRAGSGANKQNAFDDFIAAAEWLVADGIAKKGAIAAQGRSNGGLLVAAAINQRPDLFAAANPDVGVYDMLRFDRFTSGHFWTGDYGDPDDPADWDRLRRWSPYHNIHSADYPAILVTTADHDDRVVPAHSFKYVAALQAGATGSKPHLLRIEHDAGHGGGTPTGQAIDTAADVLAFLAYFTGLPVPR